MTATPGTTYVPRTGGERSVNRSTDPTTESAVAGRTSGKVAWHLGTKDRAGQQPRNDEGANPDRKP